MPAHVAVQVDTPLGVAGGAYADSASLRKGRVLSKPRGEMLKASLASERETRKEHQELWKVEGSRQERRR